MEQKKSIRKRFPHLKKPINKSNIVVKPNHVEKDSNKYMDVIAEEGEEEDLQSLDPTRLKTGQDFHIYEELPMGPLNNAANYPDVKISEL